MNLCKYSFLLVLFNLDSFIIHSQLIDNDVPAIEKQPYVSNSDNSAFITQYANERNGKAQSPKCDCRDFELEEPNKECKHKMTTCSMCSVCFEELYNKTEYVKLKSKWLLYNRDHFLYSQLSIGSQKRDIASVLDELGKIELQITKRMSKDNFLLEDNLKEHGAIRGRKTIEGTVTDYEKNTDTLMARIHTINTTLDDLRKKNHLLLGDDNLNNKLNFTALEIFSFEEAYDSLSTSKILSDESQPGTIDFKSHLLASENRRQNTENLLSNISNKSSDSSSGLLNNVAFDRITREISKLQSNIQAITTCPLPAIGKGCRCDNIDCSKCGEFLI